jgi:hypothetical protein
VQLNSVLETNSYRIVLARDTIIMKMVILVGYVSYTHDEFDLNFLESASGGKQACVGG